MEQGGASFLPPLIPLVPTTIPILFIKCKTALFEFDARRQQVTLFVSFSLRASFSSKHINEAVVGLSEWFQACIMCHSIGNDVFIVGMLSESLFIPIYGWVCKASMAAQNVVGKLLRWRDGTSKVLSKSWKDTESFEILNFKLSVLRLREWMLSHFFWAKQASKSPAIPSIQLNRNKNPQTHPGSTFADRRSVKGKSLYLVEDSKTKPPLTSLCAYLVLTCA